MQPNTQSSRSTYVVNAGQSKEIPLPITAKSDTLGDHQVNVMILDEDANHLFDATGFSQTVTVRDDPLTLDEVAEIIQTTDAAVGVVAVVFTVGGFLYGRRSNSW